MKSIAEIFAFLHFSEQAKSFLSRSSITVKKKPLISSKNFLSSAVVFHRFNNLIIFDSVSVLFLPLSCIGFVLLCPLVALQLQEKNQPNFSSSTASEALKLRKYWRNIFAGKRWKNIIFFSLSIHHFPPWRLSSLSLHPRSTQIVSTRWPIALVKIAFQVYCWFPFSDEAAQCLRERENWQNHWNDKGWLRELLNLPQQTSIQPPRRVNLQIIAKQKFLHCYKLNYFWYLLIFHEQNNFLQIGILASECPWRQQKRGF